MLPSYLNAGLRIARYTRVVVEISEGSVGLGSHCGLQLVDQSAEVAGHGPYVGTALNMRIDVQYHREVLQMMVMAMVGFGPHLPLSRI